MSDTVRWVRIIKVPTGDAPLWAREAWLDVELPDSGEMPEGDCEGFATPQKSQADPASFAVSARVAINALWAKNPAAARWFYDHTTIWGRHGRGQYIFDRSGVIIIPPPASPPPSAEIRELFQE